MKTKLAQLMAVLLAVAIHQNTSFSQIINLGDTPGCLVSDVAGKVTYNEEVGAAPKSLTAGTVLSEDATVMVGKKAAVTLVCDDRSLVVNKKGFHKMTVLAKEVQSKGAASKFAKMAFAAKGYGTTPPDTTKKARGWGGIDSILFKLPRGSKLPMQPTTFGWTPLKDGSVYKLTIYQNSKEAALLVATTSAASFTFEPTQLAVNADQVYHAYVTLANDSKVTSRAVNFSFVSPKVAETALMALQKDKDYLKGNTAQKALMEAVELENQGLYPMADERYQKAIKLDANNSMAKRMYVAFLDRVNK